MVSRERQAPDYYGMKVNAVSDLPKEPLTLEVVDSSEKEGGRNEIFGRKRCLGAC